MIYNHNSFLLCLRSQRKNKEPTMSDIHNSSIAPNNSQLDFDDFSSLFDSFK